MATLLEYRDNLRKYGACAKNMRLLDKAMENGDKGDMIAVATSIQGADVTCDSFAFGWGLDKERYMSDFSEYVKGVILAHSGYNCQLFVGHTEPVHAAGGLIILLGCKCTVKLQNGCAYTIYSADSDIRIYGGGEIDMVEYGDCSTLLNEAVTVLSRKEYTQSHWIK